MEPWHVCIQLRKHCLNGFLLWPDEYLVILTGSFLCTWKLPLLFVFGLFFPQGLKNESFSCWTPCNFSYLSLVLKCYTTFIKAMPTDFSKPKQTLSVHLCKSATPCDPPCSWVSQPSTFPFIRALLSNLVNEYPNKLTEYLSPLSFHCIVSLPSAPQRPSEDICTVLCEGILIQYPVTVPQGRQSHCSSGLIILCHTPFPFPLQFFASLYS